MVVAVVVVVGYFILGEQLLPYGFVARKLEKLDNMA